jgi:hypothetical protein
MVTRHTLGEARELLSDAEQYGNVFNLVYSGLTYWLDRYADANTAWYHGIKHYLLEWLDENYAGSVNISRIAHSPEMATAIGELVERMLD